MAGYKVAIAATKGAAGTFLGESAIIDGHDIEALAQQELAVYGYWTKQREIYTNAVSPAKTCSKLSWSLDGTERPGDDPLHQEPGCMVAHTAWWKRLLDNHGPEHDAATPQEWLLQLRQQAQARGAGCLSLPLVARAR